jgi:pimeloyl-ACP methyl ester carboxylesterase
MEKHVFASAFGDITYYRAGTGKSVVFLHGWGQDFSSFESVAAELIADRHVVGIDLPGFGGSALPETALSVPEYAAAVKELLAALGIEKPIIVAHSFGGRIALRLGADGGAEKLILISSAGLKKRGFSHRYRVVKYKILKRIYKLFSPKKYERLLLSSGSADYRRAGGVMRDILVKAVNYDARKDMRRISCPVYLFWGLLDTETPYRDGLRMRKLIRGSVLMPFYNSGHFCFQQEERRFIRILKSCL